MLVKLETSDIDRFWPMMKRALEGIPDSHQEYDKVLKALLEGLIQCWLIVDDKDIIGFVTTQIGIQEPESKKILILRDLWSLNGIPNDVFIDAGNTLENFAKTNECKEIIGYTNNKAAIARAKQLGYEVFMTVKKEVT